MRTVPTPEWSGERLVSRTRVAEVLGCHPVTVSRNLSAYCVMVGALQRYDLARIIRDHRLEVEDESR